MKEADEKFLNRVRCEIQLARTCHPIDIHSAHEGYAVIAEEMDEFWDQVRLPNDRRVKDAMLTELVQVAAMAMRTAVDLELIR